MKVSDRFQAVWNGPFIDKDLVRGGALVVPAPQFGWRESVDEEESRVLKGVFYFLWIEVKVWRQLGI